MQGDPENPETPEAGGKKPRVWSQAQLDGQRAFTLKAALKKGALAPDDQTWLDEWSKAHPPKPKAAPKVVPLRVAEPEAEPEYPDPERLEGAPKIDVKEKAKGKKPGGPRWQAKHYETMASAMAITMQRPDGTVVKLSLEGENGRELACVLGASFVTGAFQYLEAALATVGKKPLVPVEVMFSATVIALDKYLPAKLNPEPEHVVAIGFASAAVTYGLNFKAIREAQKKTSAADEHKRKLEAMREATRQAEAKHAEQNRANEVATHAAHATPSSAPPQPPSSPSSVPDTTDPSARDKGPLTMEPLPRTERPEGWRIDAPADLPDDAVI